jgi:hypothetical protein
VISFQDMVKLPFVVQPKRKPIIEKVGSEESGYIQIERRGYLTSGEKSFVQQAISSDDGTVRIINLARKINSSSLDEGYQDVLSILSGTHKEDPRLKGIEMEYFTEFTELLNSLSLMQSKEELITALCLLMYRVNPETDVNDVLTLHPDIIKGLAKLYKDEEMKSLEAFESKESQDEESQEEASAESIEKKRSKRTPRTE